MKSTGRDRINKLNRKSRTGNKAPTEAASRHALKSGHYPELFLPDPLENVRVSPCENGAGHFTASEWLEEEAGWSSAVEMDTPADPSGIGYILTAVAQIESDGEASDGRITTCGSVSARIQNHFLAVKSHNTQAVECT
ncbi:unnamed protein product [Pleuronectes platessa]|uniref:Uncharacterized protein n=1 Tax=Pleuronectes platessa TaxID=8262 RepID=A0A9N7UVB6_PLEPL|nr:unnamed protein product [Pleuronectes platessa]